MPQLLGVFENPDHVAGAVRRLRDRGYGELEVFSPAPFQEIDDAVDPRPSGVRGWTLAGGLTGVVTGYAMTIWMANNWKIMLGGKPFSSIPPYTIIAFELTILFGALMTGLGLFVVGRLPSFHRHKAYSARFSAEDFGVVVSCKERDVSEIDGLLREHHAKEVSLVEA
jgi:Protein of unknown function (DUF3341)